MATVKPDEVWTAKHVRSLAPDAASLPAAREVLRKGGFGTVEPTADSRGWWVVCRGITDTYQVSVRSNERAAGTFDCECTCPSPKYPCKHALALLLYLVEHPELRTEAEAPKVSASDFDALLRAVFANPDEDTPRLVFADFLEENGDSDRAALIRYQCEQWRVKANTKRHKELTKLLKPLLAKAKKLIEPLPERAGYELHRGFVRLKAEPGHLHSFGALPARLANLFREGWVERVQMDYYYSAADADLAPVFAAVGELDVARFQLNEELLLRLVADTDAALETGRLARVKVNSRDRTTFEELTKAVRGEVVLPAEKTDERSYSGVTPQLLALLARAGRLCGAERLTLRGAGALGDADVSTLLAADLSDLRTLRLDNWSLSASGTDALANEPQLAQLRTLDFETVQLGGEPFAALARGTGLGSVEGLSFTNCALTDADLEALAKSPNFPSLVGLRIDHGTVTAAGVAAVLASKHFPKLTGLTVYEADIAARDLFPLVLNAPDRKQLSVATDSGMVTRRSGAEMTVEVSGNSDYYSRFNEPTDLLAGLARAPGAKQIAQFRAPQLRIGGSHIESLATGRGPAKLWALDLSGNPLRNDGCVQFAAHFAEFKLRELKLSGCRVQSAGTVALLGAPFVNTLRVFDLSGNNLGAGGIKALLKAELPELRELVLTGCRIDDHDKTRLKAKFGAKVKV